MPDDNRFEGLGEELQQSGEESTNHVEDVEDSNDDTEEEPEGGPSFSFEESEQVSIYPRTETAEETLDDVEFEVETVLRKEFGIRDLAGRELHDAMIQLAAEQPEDVAELIEAARNRR
mgnify:CR=1 FL=1